MYFSKCLYSQKKNYFVKICCSLSLSLSTDVMKKISCNFSKGFWVKFKSQLEWFLLCFVLCSDGRRKDGFFSFHICHTSFSIIYIFIECDWQKNQSVIMTQKVCQVIILYPHLWLEPKIGSNMWFTLYKKGKRFFCQKKTLSTIKKKKNSIIIFAWKKSITCWHVC